MVHRIAFLCYLMMLTILPSGHCLESVLGVKAGVGHFSYVGRDYKDLLEGAGVQNELKLGLVAGLFAVIEITKFFVFQPEILLIRAGDALSEPASAWDSVLWGPYYGRVKYIDRVTYVAIPLLLKFRLGTISFHAGPTPMLMIGDGELRLKADDDWLQDDLEYTGMDSVEYAEEVFSSFALAAAAGIGIEFPVGRRGGIFMLEARGHYIFTNVLGEGQGMDFQAYAIMVTAGYGVSSRGRELRRSRIR